MDLLDADVIENDVAHKVIIATVDGHAPLIVHLCLALAKDVDVLVAQMLNGVHAFGVAMDADEDGMGHVCP